MRFSLVSWAVVAPVSCLALAVSSSNLTSRALLSSGNVILNERWSVAYEKAKTMVDAMSNEAKINVTTGLSTSSYTPLNTKDGAQGVISYLYASGFSEPSSLAATWDRDLIYTQMKAVGDEYFGKGYQLINGPTSGPLGRIAWGGRLAEGLGSDPYLNGIVTGRAVSGLSDAGIIVQAKVRFECLLGQQSKLTTAKHFLLNEQESNRTIVDTLPGAYAVYSSNADDKTIHETYMWPFYDAVKAGVGSAMCAMPQVNGTHACENSALLNGLLKLQIGFPGAVLADLWAQFTSFGSLNGGEDFGSSTLWAQDIILAGLKNGSVSQERLDDMAIRNVMAWYYAGLDSVKQPSLADNRMYRDVRANHSKIIREVGAAAISLLKNVNGALPLKAPHTMAIFGANAGPVAGGPNVGFSINGSYPTYPGHLATSTGSGTATLPYLMTPYEVLNMRAMTEGTMFSWIMADTWTQPTGAFAPIEQYLGNASMAWFFGGGTNQNVTIPMYASNTEVCIVFINAWSGEGSDRVELRNEDQDALILEVASYCNNTIVVVTTVGPRIVSAWSSHENVTAILYSGLLGQNSGLSIVDVLYGDVNPSGRLVHTLAASEDDYPARVCATQQCEFSEGNLIDYKWFDAKNITPSYPFGHGLSYTSFSYSALDITQTLVLNNTYATAPVTQGGRADLWDQFFNVSITIANSGAVDGHEVVQLYISFPAEAEQPLRQLRGFERVLVQSGAEQRVTFEVRRRDVSYWDVVAQEWAVASGLYTFAVGASSRDLRVTGTAMVSIGA
ncbi:hypothetical protein BP5796_06689 [Coleophoma crateriformis]|uniref:beta-glucosidase n=1 Tax=Coleophoma crateriformis TaxID=565419 RepID=A0A3D8RPI4_9HELO|nr:hypothetical protein BP5796_06689 [Coleophoma crateriformis]